MFKTVKAPIRFTLVIGVSLATFTTISGYSQSTLTKPATPVIDLLVEKPEKIAAPKSILAPNNPEQQSNDPRTRLLARADRIGFGKNATGGSNYVYVTTFEELDSALSTDGNYVLLDPSLSGKAIGFKKQIYPGNNITLDGSLAPGSVLYPDYDSGFPNNNPMINNIGVGGDGNKIFHSLTFEGRREFPYNGNRTTNVGALFLREGNGYWVDHVEITDFWDDAILTGFSSSRSSDYITISNTKIHNTDKGPGIWNIMADAMGKGHITIFASELNAAGRNPSNGGAENLHFFNNWVHDWRWQAAAVVGVGGIANGQNLGTRTTDGVMLSENNVYQATNATNNCAEQADPSNWGGWIYSNNRNILNGHQICGEENYVTDNSRGPGRPEIPYDYTLLPSEQVVEHVKLNAGALR